jgi:hypothetical protein
MLVPVLAIPTFFLVRMSTTLLLAWSGRTGRTALTAVEHSGARAHRDLRYRYTKANIFAEIRKQTAMFTYFLVGSALRRSYL